MCVGEDRQQQANAAMGSAGRTGNQQAIQSMTKGVMNSALGQDDGGVDMNAYRAYVQEQSARGVRPLPPQQWAVAMRSVNR